MIIHSTLTNSRKQILDVVYTDYDTESEIAHKKIHAVHAYCFYQGKLVVVYADKKRYWSPVGGGVEEGETVLQAVTREVQEESNMRVVHHQLIGCMDIIEPQGLVSQTRSVCIVEPYGPFIVDPDGDITRIALIDPGDYKRYFDWKEIGDHVMGRALDIKRKWELE